LCGLSVQHSQQRRAHSTPGTPAPSATASAATPRVRAVAFPPIPRRAASRPLSESPTASLTPLTDGTPEPAALKQVRARRGVRNPAERGATGPTRCASAHRSSSERERTIRRRLHRRWRSSGRGSRWGRCPGRGRRRRRRPRARRTRGRIETEDGTGTGRAAGPDEPDYARGRPSCTARRARRPGLPRAATIPVPSARARLQAGAYTRQLLSST